MVLIPIVFVRFDEKAKYCNTFKNFQTRILFAYATVNDVMVNLLSAIVLMPIVITHFHEKVMFITNFKT
jgi:hypothetical protein